MERYDGKTRKDDIKKYVLIGVGVVLLIILYNLTTYAIRRLSHPTPDMSVVIASTKILDDQMTEDAEKLLSPLVGDLDGNGKAGVDVIPLNLWRNSAIEADSDSAKLSDYMSDGTYHLFLISSDANWSFYCKASFCRELPEDLATGNAYCVKLPGNALFQDEKMGLIDFYGCIHKDATDAEYDAMVALLRALKEKSE